MVGAPDEPEDYGMRVWVCAWDVFFLDVCFAKDSVGLGMEVLYGMQRALQGEEKEDGFSFCYSLGYVWVFIYSALLYL